MKMRHTAAAMALVATMGATAWAQPWNKKTNLEVKETILIPGKELPPGKYVMKLMDSTSNRNIVQIFNEDEKQIQATILAIPNYRLKPTGDTELRYWESASGTPPALRAWFYPGDNYGQEFAYPKEVAEQIAARNKDKVSWYEGTGDPDSLRTATIHDGPESESSETQTASATSPAAPESEASNKPQGSAATTQGSSATSQDSSATQAPATTQRPQESSEPSMAQPAAPMQEQVRVQSRDQQPASSGDETAVELPKTGSPLWTMVIAGAVMLALGTGFARSRRRPG